MRGESSNVATAVVANLGSVNWHPGTRPLVTECNRPQPALRGHPPIRPTAAVRGAAVSLESESPFHGIGPGRYRLP